MSVVPWINLGPPETRCLIPAVTARYPGAQFVGDLAVADGKGGWTEYPLAVFWQPEPPNGYDHYFGLHLLGPLHQIRDASCVAKGVWHGAMTDDGEVVFSRFRHDYRTSQDGSVVVDGGRDYFKGRGGRMVELVVVDGSFRLKREAS